MTVPAWVSYTLFGAGLLASLFYGLKACDAFEVKATDKPWAWHVHQFWFNFAGSLAGWTAAWFAVRKAWSCIELNCPAHLGWSDAALISVALVGVTGHLPYAIAGVLQGIKELALKVAGLSK